YAPSVFSLGYQHFRGLGVAQDYKEAKAYFQKSAALGHADAHALLASLYYYGLGVAEDFEGALTELEKGVEKGSDQARAILNEINKRGSKSFSELDRVKLHHAIPTAMYPLFYEEVKSNDVSVNGFEGVWKGRMITYDWSGQKVMDEADLSLTISRSDQNLFNANLAVVRSNLNQYPDQNLSFPLTQTGNEFQIENATLKEHAFTGREVETNLQRLKLVLDEVDGTTYLKGNLGSVNAKNGEVGRPISIILQRNTTQDPSSLTIYPNPFENHFDLQFTSSTKGAVKVTIHSLDGKTVETVDVKQTSKGTNSIRISPSKALDKGIYLLSLTTDQGVESQLIFKN
ncbi:MAG: T9SS type A sorting domain-containing protein, partial [Bacteroidota bacterium]